MLSCVWALWPTHVHSIVNNLWTTVDGVHVFFVDPACHTGWGSFAWDHPTLWHCKTEVCCWQEQFTGTHMLPSLSSVLCVHLFPTARYWITIYCSFSLGTAVKLEKIPCHGIFLTCSVCYWWLGQAWASPTLAWLHCVRACVCLLACLRGPTTYRKF